MENKRALCLCLLKTLLLSLLTHPKKGHAIIYLISPPPIHACIYPASQPGYEHIAGPGGSSVDNLRCVHMAEQRAREEDWHVETKQVYDSEA